MVGEREEGLKLSRSYYAIQSGINQAVSGKGLQKELFVLLRSLNPQHKPILVNNLHRFALAQFAKIEQTAPFPAIPTLCNEKKKKKEKKSSWQQGG